MTNQSEQYHQLTLEMRDVESADATVQPLGVRSAKAEESNSHTHKTETNPEFSNHPVMPLKHSRRSLSKVKLAFATGILAAAGMGAGFGYEVGFNLPDVGATFSQQSENKTDTESNPFHIGEGQSKNGSLFLGDKETIFQEQMMGYMSWTPDGPITYWTTSQGKKNYLLTGGQDNATYLTELNSDQSLRDLMANGNISNETFTKVLGPDYNNPDSWRREYVGITGFIQNPKNPDHLYGVAHGEKRTDRDASSDYTSTIGLVESIDGGKSWADKGSLIQGTDIKEPGGGKVSGAGQPTIIYNPNDEYAYIMYIDWSATGKHTDQLYMARMKVNDDFTLNPIEYYTNNGFTTDFNQEHKSVIPVPNDSNFIYTALPHISWNTELKQFTVQGESDNGFWTTYSTNLTDWSEPKIFYDFIKMGGKPHSILKVGEKWDSYPTILSENMPNSQLTDKSGNFYHSSGDNITPHEPAQLEFNFR